MAGYAAWLWGGVSLQDHAQGIRVAQRAPGWFKRENKAAKRALAPGDIIISVDGKAGMDRSGYLAYLMRDVRLGAKVKLKVLRGGEEKAISFRVPKKQPEVQGY
jgi:S1-C subfamily serine protease